MPKKKESKGAPKWMVTFSDLMTLILVFFVLLFSMSQIDAVKFKMVVESLSGKALEDEIIEEVGIVDEDQDLSIQEKLAKIDEMSLSELREELEKLLKERIEELIIDEELDELYEEMKQYVKENELEEELIITRNDEGIEIVIQDKIIFDTAEAEIKEEALPLLDKISYLIANIEHFIRVEGHTDNRAIKTSKFPSNWELSGARASSIIRYFEGEHSIEGERLISIGYGETRPTAENDSPENWEKNRRVVIVITKEQ